MSKIRRHPDNNHEALSKQTGLIRSRPVRILSGWKIRSAKAIIAWNPETNEVRSGQIKAGSGFSYWLLKFDGVSGNKDKELEDPAGYGMLQVVMLQE